MIKGRDNVPLNGYYYKTKQSGALLSWPTIGNAGQTIIYPTLVPIIDTNNYIDHYHFSGTRMQSYLGSVPYAIMMYREGKLIWYWDGKIGVGKVVDGILVDPKSCTIDDLRNLCAKQPIPERILYNPAKVQMPTAARPASLPQAPLDGGMKFDGGKPDYTILPWDALTEVVKVMEDAITPAKGYKRGSWAFVPSGRFRYLKAAFRHVLALIRGEKIDKDSGLHHGAHLACCALFIIHYDTYGESYGTDMQGEGKYAVRKTTSVMDFQSDDLTDYDLEKAIDCCAEEGMQESAEVLLSRKVNPQI